jgi:uncharacterized lipoprotein YmbA
MLAISVLIINGCLGLGEGTQTPTKFYVLHSLQSSGDEIPAMSELPDISIGVGPIRIPQYLERPQIVSRTSQNRLQLAQFDQWAEPIRINFSRVLAENLSILLATKRVSIFPWLKSTKIDFQIILEITRFDGVRGENALLRARWSIFGKDGKEMLLNNYSDYREPIATGDTEDLVAAQGRTVKHLSREIAQALQALAGGENSGQ